MRWADKRNEEGGERRWKRKIDIEGEREIKVGGGEVE